MTSKYDLEWFYDQQSDFSYFAREEQKDSLGDLVDAC